MNGRTFRAWLLAAAAVAAGAAPLNAQAAPETSVGMPGRLTGIVLPGTELIPAQTDVKSKVLVRVVAVYPHGSSLRYDFEYEGFEPGAYDLREALVRKDGSATADLPPLPIAVRSLLPPGQILPNATAPDALPRIGGYRTLLVLGAVLWVAGFAAIVLAGRNRAAKAKAAAAKPQTLADRLRPLVALAIAGQLSRSETARLEISLVALWRRRLGLDGRRPEDVLPVLRAHPDAGPLLRALEEWLHQPNPKTVIDVSQLLAPYQSLSPDELEHVDAPAQKSE